MWVSPFRYLRIDVYLPLPAAFRSLSRLSSALSAKASTLRSLSLNHHAGNLFPTLTDIALSVGCVFVLFSNFLEFFWFVSRMSLSC